MVRLRRRGLEGLRWVRNAERLPRTDLRADWRFLLLVMAMGMLAAVASAGSVWQATAALSAMLALVYLFVRSRKRRFAARQ